MKILIVDDNVNDRALLRLNLERHGCETVVEARDGQEGFELAKTHRPDLIISDALMPRLDGFQFLKAVKADSELHNIPFIFHSSVYTGFREQELALSLGARDFIPKPQEPEKLWEMVAAILAGPATGSDMSAATRPVEETEKEYLRKYSGVVAAKLGEKVRELENNLVERKMVEDALCRSEEQRIHLQAELACAAAVQAKLLPSRYPEVANFEFAACCLPARQVGGDFYDWIEVGPGVIAVTLGDVMGNGMSAAMLMTTVRAAIHSATLQNSPAAAVQLTERALCADLESSESFVTLFHAHLNTTDRTLHYVDCGHGHLFLRHADGMVEEPGLRGLPLGVVRGDPYQEGVLTFAAGDALVVYSDGLIDARPELALTNRILSSWLDGAASAGEMLRLLLALPALDGPPPDDLAVMVIRCTG